MNETQKTISEWADAAFGPTPSFRSVLGRANLEMAELVKMYIDEPENPKLVEEAADVVICLMRGGEMIGVDFLAEALDEFVPTDPARSAAEWLANADLSLCNARYYVDDLDHLIYFAGECVLDLMQFVAESGGNLQDAINAKMAINRRRQWKRLPGGHGQHIEEAPSFHERQRAAEFFAELEKE